MKKIIRMAAMLAVAGAALLTSCTKDYSGDIKDLQDKVSALSKTVDAIQGQVNNGAILTAVNKTANGIQVVTTNGSYDITNGKDGNNGTVWTIGEDGFWYCDGKKSDYAKGSTVTVKDGVLYVDGQATEIASKGITAVWNEEKAALELYGVEGGQGDNGYVCISLDGKMKSLVFDPKAYVDGVEAILVKTFEYSPLKDTLLDSSAEVWKLAKDTVQVSPATVAEYFVNPKSAVITAEDALEFVVNANDEYIKTRAEASKDFDVKAEFVSYEAGKLKVNVTVNGVPATQELLSVVALKVTPAEDADAAVVSDFAVVASSDLEDLVIADPKAEAEKKKVPQNDEHYRTVLGAVDAKAYNQTVVWSANADMKEAKATCDTVVVYNQTLDLNGVVAAHKIAEDVCAGEATAEQLEALGLTWDFAIVKNYKVGNPATDQADFIALSADGILTPKVFETAGKASIGRTPIVRVKLMHDKDVVKVAYVKVMIVDESEVPAETPKYELNVYEKPESDVIGTFEFNCGLRDTVYTNVEEMNVRIYNDLKMSKDVFHSIYTELVDIQDSILVDGKKVANIGTAKEYEAPNAEVEATHAIMWYVENADLWQVEGNTLYHDVKYVGANGAEVLIRLKADVTSIKKSYDVAAPDYIKEYWNAEKTITYANVHTPDKGETDPAECVFVADLNAPFVTNEGKLLLNEAITDFEYYFCEKDIVNIKKIGDYEVSFKVSEDKLSLLAKITKPEQADTLYQTIATINNSNTAVPFNTITLNKNSEYAKMLLNVADGKKVDGLYTYIGVTGYVCGDRTKSVNVTFQGQDHYRINFLRPINIGTESADKFIDGVDFGEKGSYIEVKKLINPYDWRGRYFNKVEKVNNVDTEIYANYWSYYGPFQVTVDTENIECDLNGKRQALPATIIVSQVNTVAGAPASDYGYVTYRNNGNNVDKFNMFIKVKVTYGWGEILSDEIKVPVESTIGVDENN